MKTKMSNDGQIVLPISARRRLGLAPGAEIDVAIEADRLVLTPKRKQARRFRHSTSGVSGLPVLKVCGVPPEKLTSDQVTALLSDFP